MSLPISSTISRSTSSKGRPGQRSWRRARRGARSPGLDLLRRNDAKPCRAVLLILDDGYPEQNVAELGEARAGAAGRSRRGRVRLPRGGSGPRPPVAQADDSIFMSPLSMGPTKSVCGLTRLTSTTPSASTAQRSRYRGMPSASPTDTTSMVARTGAPTLGMMPSRRARALPFGGRPAVGSHGRHDERLAPGRADGRRPRVRWSPGRRCRGCPRRRRSARPLEAEASAHACAPLALDLGGPRRLRAAPRSAAAPSARPGAVHRRRPVDGRRAMSS